MSRHTRKRYNTNTELKVKFKKSLMPYKIKLKTLSINRTNRKLCHIPNMTQSVPVEKWWGNTGFIAS